MSTWTLDVDATVARGLRVRRHRLPSGLRVLVAVDRAQPVLAYQTWYGVGSRHEQRGATGLAHLFEHLMFSQTKTLAPGEFDRVVERTGGESNAATWVDWTYYRLSLPARELPLAIRLESERMTDLVLEPPIVEAERDVVTNERRERVEDDVDGWLDERMMALAFGDHPYGWPTIGWMQDIRGVSLDTIRAFYRAWYAPNNATLVVVGDVDEDALLRALEAAYGRVPAATLPVSLPLELSPQTAPREERRPRPIATDRLLAGYAVPGQGHADWAALELAATLLAGGPSSRLYRRLVVEAEVASSVDVQLTPFAGPAVFRISATCARGHRADEALALIDDELARLAAEAPGPDELATARSLVETDFWTGLVDVDGKAEALGHAEVTLGDFRSIDEIARRLATTTAEAIRSAVATHLAPARRNLVVAEPGGDDDDDGDGGGSGSGDSDGDGAWASGSARKGQRHGGGGRRSARKSRQRVRASSRARKGRRHGGSGSARKGRQRGARA